MKKIIIGLAVGVSLAATAAAMAADAKKLTLGVSIPAADHGWTGGVVYHAERIAKELRARYPGLTVIVKTSPSAAEQANALQDLVSVQKIDALVVLPQNSDELTEEVKEVKKHGVFVTIVDRALKDPSLQDLYVAGNNPQLGSISGEYLKTALNGKGDVVVLRGLPTVIDDERVKGFEDAIKGSGIKVLDKQYANWNRDDGFKVMQDFLTKYKKIDAVWAQDDDIATGALEAIKQANRSDIKIVIGGAGMKDFVKRVMDGDTLTPVDVLYPPAMIGTAMELTAAGLYDQVPIRGSYVLGAPLVTKDNAKQYYFPDSPF